MITRAGMVFIAITFIFWNGEGAVWLSIVVVIPFRLHSFTGGWAVWHGSLRSAVELFSLHSLLISLHYIFLRGEWSIMVNALGLLQWLCCIHLPWVPKWHGYLKSAVVLITVFTHFLEWVHDGYTLGLLVVLFIRRSFSKGPCMTRQILSQVLKLLLIAFIFGGVVRA